MAFTCPVSYFFFFFGRTGVRLGAPKRRFLTSPPLRLVAQAPPDGLQNIIWAFSRTPPESANASVDIKVHHAFGSTTLNMTRTAAAAPSDGTGGNGDGANGSTPTPTDGASDASEPIMPGLAGFVHAGLCMAAFLLVIPSGALVVRYAELTGSPAAFEMHRILQFGVGAFASGPLYRGLPAHQLFFWVPDSHVGIEHCTYQPEWLSWWACSHIF